jgi:predicted secreted hydrolase
MKSRLACLMGVLLILPSWEAQYRTALPGYLYEFPRDHFDHPDFQTEWWYCTGNVKSADGHRFGFELTFFRQGVDRDPAKTAIWDVRNLYLAHLALSDLDGSRFYHAERMNRAGPGIAGISEPERRIWNGNWQIQWQDNEQKLQGIDDRFQIRLTMRSEKPPVIHGENGVSQKAEGPGRASHYISQTRLLARGRIELAGRNFDVTGFAWMDHEFFTQQLEPEQVGWDWLSLQLEDETELMLFRIRRKDGSIDPYSAGTFVDARGKSEHLRASEFSLEPARESWTSPLTHATYPIRWKILVPKLGIELEVTTPLASQELTGNSKLTPSYWEGAITLTGHRDRSLSGGTGYLEMTGYDRPFEIAPRP